jgi:rare lipoprotein A
MARTGTYEAPGWWPFRALMSRMVYLLLHDDILFPPGNAFPCGEYVMRTLLVVLELCGLWLTLIPDVAHGGPSQATQVGLASWYGKQHHGRKTASGEHFSRQQLTAVHRSLPLGTKMGVTNLRMKQNEPVRSRVRKPQYMSACPSLNVTGDLGAALSTC